MYQPSNGKDPGSANVLRFSFTGLIVFCLCLIAGNSLITGKVAGCHQMRAAGPVMNITDLHEQDEHTFTRKGPCRDP